MKKNVKVTGQVANAHGRPLHLLKVKEGFEPIAKGRVLKYETVMDEYETAEEIRAANEWPKDKEIVTMKNAAVKAAVKAKRVTEMLDELGVIKPDMKNDDQLKLKKMYDVFMSVEGTTVEVAREKASTALGIEWADADDDE